MQMKLFGVVPALMALTIGSVWAQVNTGSDGSDGVLEVTTSTNIDMRGHANGIYRYVSVNIADGGVVTFTPNTNNTPVVWLVQNNVTIAGTVDLSGSGVSYGPLTPGQGGPGGYRGGNGITPAGQGPGGGGAGVGMYYGGNASYGTSGYSNNPPPAGAPGVIYGNDYLIPLQGGSGGGAAVTNGTTACGGGGGGAILIAASGRIQLDGRIRSFGWYGGFNGSWYGGIGSGGAIRLAASAIAGNGEVDVSSMGGSGGEGSGRVRFDCIQNDFNGHIIGPFTQGSQFVFIPPSGPEAQLLIASVGGNPVPSTPGGVLLTPDVFISATQPNPVSVVVQYSNVPVNSAITVTLTPIGGAPITEVGHTSLTMLSGSVTVMMNIPRGGGRISAMAVTGN